MPGTCVRARLPSCMSSARLSRTVTLTAVVRLTRSAPISALNIDCSLQALLPHSFGLAQSLAEHFSRLQPPLFECFKGMLHGC